MEKSSQRNIFQGIRCWYAPMMTVTMSPVIFMYISYYIVLNSVRMLDSESLSYEMRACDTQAGYKHNCTKPFLNYLQTEVMQMCREHGLNQVDLFGSQNRVTNAEYRANQRGQMDIGNGNAETKTKFQTDKEIIRQAILAVIEQSADLEEFKKKLFASSGIEVKESRGRFSYVQSGKKRGVTGKKLGDAHTKEAVEAAAKELRQIFGEEKLPLVKSLKEEKAILSAQKEKQYQEYQVIRSRWSELKKIIQNRNSLLTRENAPQYKKNPTGLG